MKPQNPTSATAWRFHMLSPAAGLAVVSIGALLLLSWKFVTPPLVAAAILIFGGVIWWGAHTILKIEAARQRALERIQESERRFHAATDSANNAIIAADSAGDIRRSYRLHANCYISKPADFDSFTNAISVLEKFLFAVVTLPP